MPTSPRGAVLTPAHGNTFHLPYDTEGLPQGQECLQMTVGLVLIVTWPELSFLFGFTPKCMNTYTYESWTSRGMSLWTHVHVDFCLKFLEYTRKIQRNATFLLHRLFTATTDGAQVYASKIACCCKKL